MIARALLTFALLAGCSSPSSSPPPASTTTPSTASGTAPSGATPVGATPAGAPPGSPGSAASGSATAAPAGSASTPQMGEPCGAGDACAPGLTCVSYYGIAGPRGPQFKSCEIRCTDDKACPTGKHCRIVADGPGQVCR